MAQPNQPTEMQAQMHMFADHFHRLQMEMRAQSAPGKVTDFAGDGTKNFTAWVRDMERARVTLHADDERLRVLTLQTLSGQAAEYAARLISESPNITWNDLKDKLRVRYSDTADMLFARQTLKQIKQQKRETVQNFYDRLLALAEESYTAAEIQSNIVQQQLVEIFTDGLINDHVARKLIRQKPDKLSAALDIAAEEQVTARTFELRRRTIQSHEPMEVDMQQSDSLSSQISHLKQMVQLLNDRINCLPPPASRVIQYPPANSPYSKQYHPSRQYNGHHPSRQYNGHSSNAQFRAHQTPQYRPRPNNARPNQPQRPQPNYARTNDARRPTPKWTQDGRPVCINCQKPGHIRRDCRSQAYSRRPHHLN